MKKLNEKQIIKKWKQVINNIKLKTEEDRIKVCKYAELHALTELLEAESLARFPEITSTIIDPLSLSSNLLPLSLKVLEGIKDLSKVHFTGQPAFALMRKGQSMSKTVNTYVINISISREDFRNISHQSGIKNLSKLEGLIVSKITEQLNKLIEEGNEIHIFLVIADIRMISEGKTHLDPQLTLMSRYHVEPQMITIDDI